MESTSSSSRSSCGTVVSEQVFFKSNLHIVCLPRLLTFRCEKKLRKVVDVIISVLFKILFGLKLLTSSHFTLP